MPLRIEQSQNPTDEERQAILLPLRAYNAAQAGVSTPEPIALLVLSLIHISEPTRPY